MTKGGRTWVLGGGALGQHGLGHTDAVGDLQLFPTIAAHAVVEAVLGHDFGLAILAAESDPTQ